MVAMLRLCVNSFFGDSEYECDVLLQKDLN